MAYVPPTRRPTVPPPHKAQSWDGDTQLSAGHGSFTNANSFDAPPVPKDGGGSGKGTSVSTPSLDVFADNIEKLISPVQKAAAALNPIAVAPGAFYHADTMRTKVSGQNGDDGLKEQYVKVLNDLVNGLTDLHDGVRQLSQKYKTTEDLNGMTAKDFQDAMDSSVTDFNQMMSDGGGSGTVTTAGSFTTGDSTTTTG